MPSTVIKGLSLQAAITAAGEILTNFVFPYLIYIYAEHPIGEVHALMAASLPPIVWSLVEFARTRRIDAVSVIVILGIALSLLAFVGGGSIRFLQLRENLVTGVVGVIFLVSAAIGRPLIYQLARARELRKSDAHAEAFDALRPNPLFRQTMMTMTIVWGVGLIAETAVACVLVFAMPIRDYLLASPFIGYGGMGLLGLWSFCYARHRRRLAGATPPAPPC